MPDNKPYPRNQHILLTDVEQGVDGYKAAYQPLPETVAKLWLEAAGEYGWQFETPDGETTFNCGRFVIRLVRDNQLLEGMLDRLVERAGAIMAQHEIMPSPNDKLPSYDDNVDEALNEYLLARVRRRLALEPTVHTDDWGA